MFMNALASFGRLGLRHSVISSQALVQGDVGAFVSWNCRGELEPVVGHELNQLGNRLRLDGVLAGEEITHVRMLQTLDGVVEVVEERIRLDVHRGR
jgi:hypothetical protein